MMVEKENLCLSLNLNLPAAVERNRFCNSSSPQLNLLTSLLSSPPRFNLLRPESNWSDSFPSSSDVDDVSAVRVEAKSSVKGIDVNLMPGMAAEVFEEGEAGLSSPNSSVSSIGGKRSERDLDEDDGDNCRKKLRLSKDQSEVLEESFKEHHTPNPKQKYVLANRLGLRPRQVEVWFQNRRARRKLKQTEVECELMKKWCENLTEENIKLQKELQELRAIKLSPHFYMQRTPPTTLTMCPSCEEHVARSP